MTLIIAPRDISLQTTIKEVSFLNGPNRYVDFIIDIHMRGLTLVLSADGKRVYRSNQPPYDEREEWHDFPAYTASLDAAIKVKPQNWNETIKQVEYYYQVSFIRKSKDIANMMGRAIPNFQRSHKTEVLARLKCYLEARLFEQNLAEIVGITDAAL